VVFRRIASASLVTEVATRRFHLSLTPTMAVIAILAVDCAWLAPGHFYPEMLLFVPVLQFGLFRMAPGRGRVGSYWVGFQLFGWAAVQGPRGRGAA
jgi:hypothetical protein